jgi:hypothetical protein
MPGVPLDALSGVEALSSPSGSLLLPLANPSREGAAFRSEGPVRIELYDASGRWVRSLSGSGEIRATLDPGLYLYRAAGTARPPTGKLIVLP